ncbi:MAG: glycosyltransferase family 4 protein [Bacteroidia bacterium]
MKILILTQYFPPEVGAPQNRLFELAVRLQKLGAEISVLTAMPNYPQMQIYKAYQGKKYFFEEMNGLKIHRSWIYVSSSKSIVPRLMNYFSFVFSSMWIGCFKLEKFDFVLCESPPLFLGITAYVLKKIKRSKLIFNVSDLWPESAEKLGLVKNKFLLSLSSKLEEFMYRKSELISGQTQGIVKNISDRFPEKKIFWLPNGVDLSFYKYDEIDAEKWRQKNNFSNTDFILLYAGIIGHAQGLEVILKAAEKLKLHPKIKFILLGSGPEKINLEQLKNQLQLENVFFFDVVAKTEMPEIIATSDVSIIPLKKLDLFKGAIPSKIFENLAMKKAILLGVEGEAKELFIDEGKCGLAFIPEDSADLANKILELYNHPISLKTFGENGYNYVQKKFTRDKIATDFWNFINLNQ